MRRLTVLAAAAFLAVIIVRFPASWCSWALPQGVACRQLEGSIWSGQCSGLVLQGAPAQSMMLGNARWALHPLQLLRGRLAAAVALERADGSLRGNLTLAPGGLVTASGLEVNALRLDHLLLPQIPPGLHGLVQARISRLVWSGRRLEAIAGQIDVQGLTDADGTLLGNYQLQFPAIASGAPTAMLRDAGGPLRVAGQLRLTAEPGFELNGRVAARPGAAAGLVDAIRYLGSPDAGGMRPFSIAGTF